MSQPQQYIQGMMNQMAMGTMNDMSGMGIGGSSRLDPSQNNMPLSFNTGKNKPPMARSTSGGYEEANRPDDSPSSTTAEGLMQQQQNNMMSGGMYGMGYGGPINMMGQMGPDASMMMMGPMAMNQYGAMNMMGTMGMQPNMMEREVITLSSCTLYPPPPGAPPRSVRERPPGCRTAFIGGLPETVTEEILQEVFEKCGNIVSMRLSKKNFAHIRFEFHDSVERALFISGYRMKIGNKDDKPNTGRIHVDYALARDDQYEYECQQRALAREMRHQQRIEEDLLRPPSPPPTVLYSDHEALALAEKLKCDDEFMRSSDILMSWMEKGDCTRRSNSQFYSLIQCINSHVRRLLMEKQQNEDELQRMKMQCQMRFQDILRQFDQIVKVFSTATKQRAWDHFTKAQRKNIDIWAKQAEEIRNAQQDEFLSQRQEDEMEMSDEDGEGREAGGKKRKAEVGMGVTVSTAIEYASSMNTLNSLKDENDTLKCQMEAYKNEVDLVKQESVNSVEEKEKQIKALQNALQGMQQQLISSQQQAKKMEKQKLEKEQLLERERAKNRDRGGADGDSKDDKEEATTETTKERTEDKSPSPAVSPTPEIDIPQIPGLGKDMPIPSLKGVTESAVSSTGISLTSKEAKILGLISCFLHVHPFGATVDYLWSYLHQMIPTRPREIEDLVERLPMLFKQELQGVGARLERRWVFVGFSSITNTDTDTN